MIGLLEVRENDDRTLGGAGGRVGTMIKGDETLCKWPQNKIKIRELK